MALALYSSENSKLGLAFSRLEVTAAKQVLPHFSKPSLEFSTLEDLYDSADCIRGVDEANLVLKNEEPVI